MAAELKREIEEYKVKLDSLKHEYEEHEASFDRLLSENYLLERDKRVLHLVVSKMTKLCKPCKIKPEKEEKMHDYKEILDERIPKMKCTIKSIATLLEEAEFSVGGVAEDEDEDEYEYEDEYYYDYEYEDEDEDETEELKVEIPIAIVLSSFFTGVAVAASFR